MRFDDEDYAYERARQQKVDNIAYLNRPQRYERVDTHKRIPFVTPHTATIRIAKELQQ